MAILKRLMLGACAAAAALVLARAGRAAWFEYSLASVPRHAPELPPDAAVLGLRPVIFVAQADTIRGWYIPSRTGAGVVVAGGSGSTRDAMLDYARLLAPGGTGVLLFDWPGSGESGGRLGIGAAERAALRSAVDFLVAQPDIRDGRVGMLGFSMGAYFAFYIASADARVRAAVLEGAFGRLKDQTFAEYGAHGPFDQWGALLGAYAAGMERITADVPAAARGFAGRPLLLVSGSQDHSVPTALTREIHDNALDPKALWVIEGASHGGYLSADSTYGPRLRRFVEESLASGTPRPASSPR